MNNQFNALSVEIGAQNKTKPVFDEVRRDAKTTAEEVRKALGTPEESFLRHKGEDVQLFLKDIATSPRARELRENMEALTTGAITDPNRRRVVLDRAKELWSDLYSGVKDVRRKLIRDLETDRDLDVEKVMTGENFKILTENTDDATASLLGLKKVLDDLEGKGSKGGGGGRGGFPTYMISTVNAAMSLGAMGASLYRGSQLAFDLNSPQGMANAITQYEIARTHIIGDAIGKIIGGSLGALGGWAGGFLGMGIGGQAGSTISQFFTTGTEKELKQYNSLFSNAQRGVQRYGGYQESIYDLFYRFGDRANIAGTRYGFLGLDESPTEQGRSQGMFDALRGSSSFGRFADMRAMAAFYRMKPEELFSILPAFRFTQRDLGSGAIQRLGSQTGMLDLSKGTNRLPEMLQILMALTQQASGAMITPEGTAGGVSLLSQLPTAIFGAGNEFGRLSQSGMSTIAGVQSLMSPSSEGHRALLFSALASGARRRGQPMDFMEIGLRMREGIFRKQNLEDLLAVMPQNEMLAKAYFSAMMPQAPAELVRRMAAMQGRGELTGAVSGLGDVYGVEDIQGMLGMAQRRVTPAMRAQQAINLSELGTGEKLQNEINALNVKWTTFLNDMTQTAKALKIMTDMAEKSRSEAEDIMASFADKSGAREPHPNERAYEQAMKHTLLR